MRTAEFQLNQFQSHHTRNKASSQSFLEGQSHIPRSMNLSLDRQPGRLGAELTAALSPATGLEPERTKETDRSDSERLLPIVQSSAIPQISISSFEPCPLLQCNLDRPHCSTQGRRRDGHCLLGGGQRQEEPTLPQTPTHSSSDSH